MIDIIRHWSVLNRDICELYFTRSPVDALPAMCDGMTTLSQDSVLMIHEVFRISKVPTFVFFE